MYGSSVSIFRICFLKDWFLLNSSSREQLSTSAIFNIVSIPGFLTVSSKILLTTALPTPAFFSNVEVAISYSCMYSIIFLFKFN